MRVLVTGGTGFIGSHTAAALLGSGREVRVLVRDAAKLDGVFGALGLAAPRHEIGDVGDEASVKRALEGCDALVHTAGLVALEAARAREVIATNARGVENVVGAALELGLERIVYVSSIGALFRPNQPLDSADAPVVPGETAYSRSKSEAELYVRRLQEEGAPIKTVYPAAVVGPDDPGLSPANHALRAFTRKAVISTPSGFQFVDVRDLAAVHLRLLDREGGPGRYLSAGCFLTWREVADGIAAVTGRTLWRVPVPGALIRAVGRIADAIKRFWYFDFPVTGEAMAIATQWAGAKSSKTEEELGLRFRDPLETLADTIRWMHRTGQISARRAGRLAFDRFCAPPMGPADPGRGRL